MNCANAKFFSIREHPPLAGVPEGRESTHCERQRTAGLYNLPSFRMTLLCASKLHKPTFPLLDVNRLRLQITLPYFEQMPDVVARLDVRDRTRRRRAPRLLYQTNRVAFSCLT